MSESEGELAIGLLGVGEASGDDAGNIRCGECFAVL